MLQARNRLFASQTTARGGVSQMRHFGLCAVAHIVTDKALFEPLSANRRRRRVAFRQAPYESSAAGKEVLAGATFPAPYLCRSRRVARLQQFLHGAPQSVPGCWARWLPRPVA